MTVPTNNDFFAKLGAFVDQFGKIDLSDPSNIRIVFSHLYNEVPNSMDLPEGKVKLFWSGIWGDVLKAIPMALNLLGRHSSFTGQGPAPLVGFLQELLRRDFSESPLGDLVHNQYFVNYDPFDYRLYEDRAFAETSYLYARTAEGRAVTLTAESRDISVWAEDEVRGFLDNIDDPNSKLTHINGVEVGRIRELLNETTLDRQVFLREFLESKAAVNILNSKATFLRDSSGDTIIDIDSDGLRELGAGDVNDPGPIEDRGKYNIIPESEYNKVLLNRAFNHLALLSDDLKKTTTPDATFKSHGQYLLETIDDYKGLASDDPLIRDQIEHSTQEFKAVASDVLGENSDAANQRYDAYKQLETAKKLKFGGFLAELALIGLEAGIKAKEFGGMNTPEFKAWALKAAAAGVVVAAVGSWAVTALSTTAFGSAVAFGGIAALTYLGVKQIAREAVVVFRDEPESFLFQAACFVLELMDALESPLKVFSKFMGSVFTSFQEATLPEIEAINAGTIELLEKGEKTWLVGRDDAQIFGNSENNLIAHTGWGEVNAGDGNDILIAWGPDAYAEGEKVGPEPVAPHGCDENGDPRIPPDTRPFAQEDLSLALYGGAGNDNIFSFGGKGAQLVGGTGQDLLFSFGTRGAQLWGNDQNQKEKNLKDFGEGDNFWWSPGAFVQDADPVDFVSLFGLPMVGGLGYDGFALEKNFWFMWYGQSDSGQLIIGNLIMQAIVESVSLGQADLLDYAMIIEDYDYPQDIFTGDFDNYGIFRGQGENARSLPGDLGLRFRIFTKDDGIEVGKIGAIWGTLIFLLAQFDTIVAGLKWREDGDPLVLDLDGDGLDTIRESQSRAYFDFDDDYFAERTGWVGSDDGILAVDLNGDGIIDDISEIFGGNIVGGEAQRGFAALAEYDTNNDGVVDALDDGFADLLVWRDLDGDGKGEGDEGELFTLEELGIESLTASGTDILAEDGTLGSVMASGATLLSEGTFTREDGSTGTVFEAIFETNTARTIYRGDKGLAGWTPTIALGAETGVAVNATGRGRSTDLAIAASNDFNLAWMITTQLSRMSWFGTEGPDLLTLRELSEPVISAWASSDPESRELTPTLVSADGTTLLDYGIYVEDASGGFWTLASGADVLDSGGGVIARASLEDILAQATADGATWQVEQLFSPTDRAEALTTRPDAPYLVTLNEGRAEVLDYGIWNDAGGYWELASGADVLDADGLVIAAPTLDDVMAQSVLEGQIWRAENKSFNEFAALPFDTVAVQLIDGIVTDFSVYVEDTDGGFHVWARNLDRALELQDIEGRPGGFSLRNYALDFNDLTGTDSTDDSHYRVELLSTEQFRFATALYGVVFQPEILAPTIGLDGTLAYSVTAEVEAVIELEPGQSQIDLAIEFFDLLMDVYIPVERGLAVRLAMQGAMADAFTGLRYDAASDKFVATTDLGLVPFFETIFTAAPANDPNAPEGEIPHVQAYLRDWKPVLDVIYADYGRETIQEVPLLRALIAAYENVGLDLDIFAIANEMGVDESKIITHDTLDTVVLGTDGRDYFYMGAGDQTFEGGQDKDFYIVGENFGHDVIRDVETFGENRKGDSLWFAHVTSDDVHAYKDGIDLIIEVLSTGDTLTIRNQFEGVQINPITGGDFSDDTEMVTITFADGVTWEERDIALATSHPLDTDDFVLGTPDFDLMDGGLGNDILQGGSDSDVYIFSRGYGVDTIQDRNREFFLDHADIVQFTGDIRAEHLELQRLGLSDDLIIHLLDDEGVRTGDQVIIENQFDVLSVPFFGDLWFDRIERLTFEDGSYLDEQQIMAQVLENAGTDGDDIIFGFDNDDRLDGGLGNDVLQGFNKDDLYIFGRDYGYDIIEDNSTNFPVFGSPQTDTDTLRLEGISAHEIELLRDGDSSTISIRITGTDDQVVLTNQFQLTSTILFGDYYFDGVEFIEFDDATWSLADLARKVVGLNNTDGDDIIYGLEFNDELDGGAGNDRLEGGIYSDTYYYRLGDGHDVIYDNSDRIFLDAGYDRLILTDKRDLATNEVIKQGIDFTDISFSREGNDLILTVISTGDTLRLEEQWNRLEDNRIDYFEFKGFSGDYTHFLPEDFIHVGTSAGETLIGTHYNETIDGRGGDDMLIGLSDGDTYLFGLGYGNDIIDERQVTSRWSTPDDTVKFGPDIVLGDVVFSKVGNDLVITINGYTDTLTILGQFNGGARDGIEQFVFADNTQLSITDVEELLAIESGGRGDDLIEGIIDAENVLDGRQGDDTLIGGNLSDTYAFGVGYDLDTITEQLDAGSDPNALDRIVFTTLVNPYELIVTRDGNDILLSLDQTADQLRIVDGLTTRQIEQFLFADGTSWTTEDVILRLLEGSSGSDQLIGFDNRDDVLDGGVGADDLQGGGGADTYHFDLGYGSDSITDTGGVDRLVFGELISSQSLLFSGDDDNLVIHFVGSEDTLVIRNALASSAHHIESLEFQDGTIIDFASIVQGLLFQLATPGDDVIEGDNTAQTLQGSEGNDYLIGRGGTDNYIFREGDGRDIIDDGANSTGDILKFTDFAAEDVSVRRANAATNDALLEIAGSTDQVLIRNGLGPDGSSAIEIIEFGNGVRWSISDLREKALAAAVSDGRDTVRGFETDDVIEAGRGDDYTYGERGSDTYIFNRLDGRDIIDDRGLAGDIDKLILRGYLAEDVIVTRPNPNDNTLKLLFADTRDEILIIEQFSVDATRGLEQIEFGDGTVWDRTIINDLIIGSGTPASETLIGNDGENTLEGREGDDLLFGGEASDTYVFSRGDGNDSISDSGSGDTDVLRLQGYSQEELIYNVDPGHSDALIITFTNSDDSIRIAGTLDGDAIGAIEEIHLDDGTVIAVSGVITLLTAPVIGDGDDYIEGTGDSDRLAGGLGDDYLSGRFASDVYEFAAGDGHDIIEDNGSSYYHRYDTLEITGYTADQIQFSKDPADGRNLIVSFVNSEDQITILNTLSGEAYDRIEEIKLLDDNSSYLINDILNLLIEQQASIGDDYITGYSSRGRSSSGDTVSNDTLDGGLGDDFLTGLDGSDTYKFAAGGGKDVIQDNGSSYYHRHDVIEISGYNSSEAIFSKHPANSTTLVINFAGSEDQIIVVDTLEGDEHNQIEEIKFLDDNISFSINDVRTQLIELQSSDGDDYIIGYGQAGRSGSGTINSDDILDGGLGNDILVGADGSDIYRFNAGDGQDIIQDAGAGDSDRIQISGYDEADLIFSRHPANTNTLVIEFVGSTDKITVVNGMSGSSADGIEIVELVGIRTWAIADIAAIATTPTLNLISGTKNNETFESTAADDFISGRNGNDTIIFEKFDGQDIIHDLGSYLYSRSDVLQIVGYSESEIIFSRSTEHSGNLVITFVGTNDRIEIVGQLTGDLGNMMETIQIVGGPSWSATEIANLVIQSDIDSGQTRIIGSDLSESFYSSTADEYFSGGEGSDSYYFDKFDGQDIIHDQGHGSSAITDRLYISGYSLSELNFSRDRAHPNNVIITFEGTEDRIEIVGLFDNSQSNLIEEIILDGNVMLTAAEVREAVLLNQSANSQGRIIGTYVADEIHSSSEDDYLSGQWGDDNYYFEKFDGQDVINEASNSVHGSTDKLYIHGYLDSEVFFSRDRVNPENLVISFAGTNDRIEIVGQFLNDLSYTVEDIVLDSGTIFTASDIAQIILDTQILPAGGLIEGTAMWETLNSGPGDDVLIGKDGADLYIFEAGDGRDVIDDDGNGDNDKLRIEGYLESEIIFTADPLYPGDLVITFTNSDDRITIINALTVTIKTALKLSNSTMALRHGRSLILFRSWRRIPPLNSMTILLAVQTMTRCRDLAGMT